MSIKFNTQTVSCEIGGRTLTIETGKIAKQADGSVLIPKALQKYTGFTSIEVPK